MLPNVQCKMRFNAFLHIVVVSLCALNVDQGYKIISSLKIDNAVVEMKESAGWRMTLRQGGVGPLVKPPQGAWPSRSGIER